MKKLLSGLLAIICLVLCMAVSGCGCSNSAAPKDKILIYSGVNDTKGPLLATVKDTNEKASGTIEQILKDIKKDTLADKQETRLAKEIYYVEYLNYDENGNKTDTTTLFIYYIDDTIYCYSPDKQTLSDGEYYLNGYTSVTQEKLNDVVNGTVQQ
ncbi:MAG: hypothetical protein J1F17_02340 [Oscillospiraceae bacterium]|nr:hypothetical protein [Oscillospiraceae bacterium]